jgi:hypothetical protein
VARISRVTGAVTLVVGLAVPAAQAAEPILTPADAQPVARLTVPFAAPDGYLFTVRPGATDALRAAHATPLMPSAGIWRVGAADGPRLAAALRSRGQLVAVDANARRTIHAADPLRAAQYAFGAIGLPAALPAPSRRILVVDTGLDVTAPDIADRAPGTTVLANAQDVTGDDGDVEWHGTAVYSTIAAAVDGVGGEGLYPQATVAMWDASLHPGTLCQPTGCLDGAQIVQALDWAIRHHYDIVSMSLGAPEPIYSEFLAVERAIAHGVLVVAAAGNEAQVPGPGHNPFEFPAAYDHVVSVAASTPDGRWAPFSNYLPTNDVSAPGVGVYATIAHGFDLGAATCSPAPTPLASGWCRVAGTSFATPITAAAAAIVWSERPGLTALRVADVLRAGARRGVGQHGRRDPRFGYGLLDVTRSLTVPAPSPDVLEPNDDIPMVKGTNGFRPERPILRVTRRRGGISALADAAEDFRDVYRADVARTATRLKLVLRHRAGHGALDDLDVCVWKASARSVVFQDDTRGRIACSKQRGARTDTLTVRLPRGTRRVYLDVHGGRRTAFAGRYSLAVARS